MKVATKRAELHKIQHKSIQVVAEGIGLENYLIRNVAALRNFTVKPRSSLETRSIQTSHCYGQFALSLGKESPFIFYPLNKVIP